MSNRSLCFHTGQLADSPNQFRVNPGPQTSQFPYRPISRLSKLLTSMGMSREEAIVSIPAN